MERNHWNGKKWFAYGTSITSKEQGTYVPYLAALSGMQVTNFGIPGGGITNLGGYSKGQGKDAIMTLADGKEKAALITLEVGANEGGAIGDKFDTGEDTFCGCLNQCIRFLQENTNAQIVVFFSPVPTSPPEERKDYYERLLKAEEVCKICGVYCLGMQSGLGYARLIRGGYTKDNIHQTELGGYNLAQFLWSKLKDIPLWYFDESCFNPDC